MQIIHVTGQHPAVLYTQAERDAAAVRQCEADAEWDAAGLPLHGNGSAYERAQARLDSMASAIENNMAAGKPMACAHSVCFPTPDSYLAFILEVEE